jgi:hypothetical protein
VKGSVKLARGAAVGVQIRLDDRYFRMAHGSLDHRTFTWQGDVIDVHFDVECLQPTNDQLSQGPPQAGKCYIFTMGTVIAIISFNITVDDGSGSVMSAEQLQQTLIKALQAAKCSPHQAAIAGKGVPEGVAPLLSSPVPPLNGVSFSVRYISSIVACYSSDAISWVKQWKANLEWVNGGDITVDIDTLPLRRNDKGGNEWTIKMGYRQSWNEWDLLQCFWSVAATRDQWIINECTAAHEARKDDEFVQILRIHQHAPLPKLLQHIYHQPNVTGVPPSLPSVPSSPSPTTTKSLTSSSSSSSSRSNSFSGINGNGNSPPNGVPPLIDLPDESPKESSLDRSGSIDATTSSSSPAISSSVAAVGIASPPSGGDGSVSSSPSASGSGSGSGSGAVVKFVRALSSVPKSSPAPVNPDDEVEGDEDDDLRAHEVRLDREIGRGNFGVVHLAERRGQQIVVKRLVMDAGTDGVRLSEDDIMSVVQEASFMKRLRHFPNILKFVGAAVVNMDTPNDQPDYGVVEYGQPNGRELWLASELMSKGSLDRMVHLNKSAKGAVPALPPWADPLAPIGALTWRQRVHLAYRACLGVAQLHEAGLIHRDIAARNFLVDDNNEVKLADFGMSRLHRSNATIVIDHKGAPLKWMSPEAISCQQFGNASDVWSLGML